MKNEIVDELRRVISASEVRLTSSQPSQLAIQVWVCADMPDETTIQDIGLSNAQAKRLRQGKKPVHQFEQGDQIKIVVILSRQSVEMGGTYAQARDAAGALISALDEHSETSVFVRMVGVDAFAFQGLLTGIGIAQYRYRQIHNGELAKTKKFFFADCVALKNVVRAAQVQAASVNLARHLTNLPANVLNPKTMSETCVQLLRGLKGVKVEVLKGERLKREKMNLQMAVGQAAEHAPVLVVADYRGARQSGAPFALVGKGVTFDSGGLDIKPSSGMRWMKKDMGGAATALATFWWAAQTRAAQPITLILPIVENAVDAKSFRPGDIIKSRKGLTVEIHNTDAEGRLILADALDWATTRPKGRRPRAVIDIATLTGAIKVALGADVAGLFSNDKDLASRLQAAAESVGDPAWRMPLYRKYQNQLNSNFADCVNATDGFGGAITAALFLDKFVNDYPWAHLDIYAWKDSSDGAYLESGGSGQAVQLLCRFLQQEA